MRTEKQAIAAPINQHKTPEEIVQGSSDSIMKFLGGFGVDIPGQPKYNRNLLRQWWNKRTQQANNDYRNQVEKSASFLRHCVRSRGIKQFMS